jgi:hypothetical protein
MIALYAFIACSYAVTVVDILIRFPLNSDAIDFSDIQVIVINLIGLTIQILIFVYGLINAMKGMLSPKRMGVVISVFFGSLCLADSNRIWGSRVWQLVYVAVMLMIPSIMGAVAAYLYFIRARVERIVPALSILLKTCIYILIMYQTYTLGQKRKHAVEAAQCQINT